MSLNIKQKSFFETNSLPLAATLLCFSCPLDSLKKDQEGKTIFIFELTPQLSRVKERFWTRLLKVEPNLFWETQRFLKSRIYGE